MNRHRQRTYKCQTCDDPPKRKDQMAIWDQGREKCKVCDNR